MKIKILLFSMSFLSINIFEESLSARTIDSLKNKNYLESTLIENQESLKADTFEYFDSEVKHSRKINSNKSTKSSVTTTSSLPEVAKIKPAGSDGIYTKEDLFEWKNNSKFNDNSIDPKNVRFSTISPGNISNNKISDDEAYTLDVFRGGQIATTNTKVLLHDKNASNVALVQNSDLMRKPVGFSDLDFSTPSSPGATMINYKGDFGSVSTPNEVAVKLLNGLSSDGKIQPGIAIDISPYLLASGTGFTLADYRKPGAGFQRFLANTKISIATAGSEKEALLGIGAEFILLNEGDPRFDETLFSDLRKILDNQPPPDADLTTFNNSIKPQIIAAKERAKKRSEQKETWVLGVGTSLVSSSGRYYDFRGNGIGLWSTYKRGLGGNSELILHGNYRSSERTSDRVGGYVNVDTVTLGTRIRTGDDKFKFSLETAYNFENQGGTASNSYISLGLGAEPKVSDNLWLSLSMTGNIGRQNGNDIQVFSGLKWNFNNGR
jgi:hypothetical protein